MATRSAAAGRSRDRPPASADAHAVCPQRITVLIAWCRINDCLLQDH